MEGEGEWEWSEDKSEIDLEFDDVVLKGEVDNERIEPENFDMEDMSFEIIRLTKDELKFEDDNGNIFECEAEE